MNKDKKEKVYKFSNLGYVQMLWDLRQERLGKINTTMSLVMILGMFGLGLLSKELLIIMLGNMGIGKVVNWLV